MLQPVVVVLVVDNVKVRVQSLPVHVLVQREAEVGPRVGVGGEGVGGEGVARALREAIALHALEAYLLDGGGDLRAGEEEEKGDSVSSHATWDHLAVGRQAGCRQAGSLAQSD